MSTNSIFQEAALDLYSLTQFYLSLADDFIGTREAVKQLILKQYEREGGDKVWEN